MVRVSPERHSHAWSDPSPRCARGQDDARMSTPLSAPRRVLIAGGGTGGHLMPALAIAEALRERAPDVEPVLVGAVRGVEARLLPTRDFRFHLLPVRADLPPHLVEERPLAVHRRPPAARDRAAVRRGASRRGAGHRRVCLRAGRLVGDAPWHPDRRAGAECVSRARDPAAEPSGASRLPGPAGGAVAAPLRFRRPAYSIPATRSPRRRPTGARRRWRASGSTAHGRWCS